MSSGLKIIGRHKGERGQTIVLVALSLFALLSMAALAIDVTTLYVADTEAQQAADAAALAGAKAFVTSGYTSYPNGFANTNWVCNGSNGLADYAAQSALAANTVAGAAPTMTTSCNFTNPENPTITVRVQRSALPIFFAKIWGAVSPSASATATAEAYNPSGASVPIQTSGVKPWLVANCDPTNSNPPTQNTLCTGGTYDYFVDPTTGAIENGGSFIGRQITLIVGTGNVTSPPLALNFYALNMPQTPAPLCPSSSAIGCGNTPGIYYDSLACFNPTPLQCGESVNGPSDPVYVNSNMNNGVGQGYLKNRTDQGSQCLIHASGVGLGQGQDLLIPQGAGQPLLIQPGLNNPDISLKIAQYISRSDSVVTVPLFNGSNLCAGGNCSQVNATTVIGFLQLGITDYSGSAGTGSVDAIIMNASGCNPGATPPAVTGGSIASIPVRLVQHP